MSLSGSTPRIVYWPGLPGRAEPIRLALEYAAIAYDDVALAADPATPVGEIQRLCGPGFACPEGNILPFAPPILEHAGQLLSQLPNVMLYLGPLTGLAPADEAGRLKVGQVFLTLCDLQNETHDTHHPIAVGDYYEAQKAEALRRSIDFRSHRLPKFLSYFNRLPSSPTGTHLVGNQMSYADVMLWFVFQGLRFAFPNALRRLEPEYPALARVLDEVDKNPRLQTYWNGPNRQPFGDGLYRAYPELDVEADLDVSGEGA